MNDLFLIFLKTRSIYFKMVFSDKKNLIKFYNFDFFSI